MTLRQPLKKKGANSYGVFRQMNVHTINESRHLLTAFFEFGSKMNLSILYFMSWTMGRGFRNETDKVKYISQIQFHKK